MLRIWLAEINLARQSGDYYGQSGNVCVVNASSRFALPLFLKMGQSWPIFILFSSFLQTLKNKYVQ